MDKLDMLGVVCVIFIIIILFTLQYMDMRNQTDPKSYCEELGYSIFKYDENTRTRFRCCEKVYNDIGYEIECTGFIDVKYKK